MISAACSLTLDYESVRPGADGGPALLSIAPAVEFYRGDAGAPITVEFQVSNLLESGSITVTLEATAGTSGISASPVQLTRQENEGTLELSIDAAAEAGTHSMQLVASGESPGARATAPVAVVVSGAPGTPDLTFSPAIPSTTRAIALVVEPKAPWRIYVLVERATDSFAILALEPSGAVSEEFGDAGELQLSYHGTSMAVDEQGRLLVAGYQVGASDKYTGFLERYSADGAPDSSFGTDQGATRLLDAQPLDLDIEANGRLWLAGADRVLFDACVWTVNAQGLGLLSSCDSAGASWVDVATQGDGAAVVVGSSATYGFRMRRYQVQGVTLVVDEGFALGSGNVLQQMGTGDVRAVATTSNTIATGGAHTDESFLLWLVTHDANDTGDPSTFNDPNTYAVADIVADLSGRLVLATASCLDGAEPTCASLIRWANGTIDPDFGDNGRYQLDVAQSPPSVFEVIAIQPDGRIVAGGESDGQLLLRRVWD